MISAMVSCLLLAAGQSRRMAGANKLLLDLDGRTVLERVCTELSRARFSDYVAVTGFESSLVEKELAAFNFRVVRNEAFSLGMHSSIRRGLMALPSTSAFFAVCLGDQPFLTAADYSALIAAADSHPTEKLIYPVVDGERGQPVLIAMSLRDEVLAHEDDDQGCKYLFARYGGMPVDLTHSANALAFYDVDTPAAFAHAQRLVLGGTP